LLLLLFIGIETHNIHALCDIKVAKHIFSTLLPILLVVPFLELLLLLLVISESTRLVVKAEVARLQESLRWLLEEVGGLGDWLLLESIGGL